MAVDHALSEPERISEPPRGQRASTKRRGGRGRCDGDIFVLMRPGWNGFSLGAASAPRRREEAVVVIDATATSPYATRWQFISRRGQTFLKKRSCRRRRDGEV